MSAMCTCWPVVVNSLLFCVIPYITLFVGFWHIAQIRHVHKTRKLNGDRRSSCSCNTKLEPETLPTIYRTVDVGSKLCRKPSEQLNLEGRGLDSHAQKVE
jgi:hypothetical protein